MGKYTIQVEGNKVIFDGHADDIETCNAVSRICDALSKAEQTISYESGHAEFEVGNGELMFKQWYLHIYSNNGDSELATLEENTGGLFVVTENGVVTTLSGGEYNYSGNLTFLGLSDVPNASAPLYKIGDNLGYGIGGTGTQVTMYIVEQAAQSDISIKYKGTEIASLSDTGTKKLTTAGYYCEDDITIEYTKPEGADLTELTAEINELGETSGTKTVDELTNIVSDANDTIDNQGNIIDQIQLALQNKASSIVEPITITENGIYNVPTGRTYSPITVDVSGGEIDFYSASQVNISTDYSGSSPYLYICGLSATNPSYQYYYYGIIFPIYSYSMPYSSWFVKNTLLYLHIDGSVNVSSIDCSGGEIILIDNSSYYGCAAILLKEPNVNIICHLVYSCFLPDTLITLADGSKKAVKDITYDDKLKVWDFDKGDFGEAEICWLTRSGLKNDHYYKLTFSDGTILKTTGQNSNHKVYNVDERYFKGVDKTEIGDRIFSENGIVTVINKEYIEEEIEYYNLITTHKINCFADGILTSDRYGNLYPIDENMVYIKEGREIRPYDEFEAVGIKRYWYDTLRLGEVTGTVEETKAYINKLECQMLALPECE